MINRIGMLVILGLVLVLSGFAAADTERARRLAMDAADWSEEEVAVIEAAIQGNPEDLDARTGLLGYYFLRHWDEPVVRLRRQEHVLWVVEHRPATAIAGLPYIDLHPYVDEAAYKRASELWQQHIERDPENTLLLANAAGFFVPADLVRAAMYLSRLKELAPDDARWPERLAQVYKLQLSEAPAEQRERLARKALAELETAYALTDEASRFYLMDGLANAALTAERLDKAEQYAKQLLELAEAHRDHGHYGNAVHVGYLVLGHLALRNDDVPQAAAYLIEAGRTPGSPQLNSFGPSMSLANALLERGQRDVVLEYLELVGQFWMEEDRIETWKRQIHEGDIDIFNSWEVR